MPVAPCWIQMRAVPILSKPWNIRVPPCGCRVIPALSEAWWFWSQGWNGMGIQSWNRAGNLELAQLQSQATAEYWQAGNGFVVWLCARRRAEKIVINIPWLPGAPSCDANQGGQLRARLWRSPIPISCLWGTFPSRFRGAPFPFPGFREFFQIGLCPFLIFILKWLHKSAVMTLGWSVFMLQ